MLSLMVVVTQLRLPHVDSGEAQHSHHVADPPWRGQVYHLVPEAPFFKRMQTGPKAFLEPLSISRL